MAQLAIEGHATRGSEVIALLEMLGGKNIYNLTGTKEIWYILSYSTIIEHSAYLFEEKGFTLEDFLEKFPYKVGDKVKQSKITDNFIGTVICMRWDGESQIIYTVEWDDERKTKLDIIALGLQPHKEEIMKELNLVELLRDCPTGMELDCLVFDNVTFDYVNTQQNRVYCKVDKSESVWFTPRGGVNLLPDAKCVIFPKGKTSWNGFVPPYKFKDGDVVATNSELQVFILQRAKSNTNGYCYIGYDFEYNEFFDAGVWEFDRLATEEEKQKLFDAIKANGYRWNAETKTLEKLLKFKVGDRIKNLKHFGITKTVHSISSQIGYWTTSKDWIRFEEQDEWGLVPNKFDITTLKAFESRVLVKPESNSFWMPSFFGFYRKEDTCPFICCNGFSYKYCIPYENNEHLLGTANDCDDFYKTWKK